MAATQAPGAASHVERLDHAPDIAVVGDPRQDEDERPATTPIPIPPPISCLRLERMGDALVGISTGGVSSTIFADATGIRFRV